MDVKIQNLLDNTNNDSLNIFISIEIPQIEVFKYGLGLSPQVMKQMSLFELMSYLAGIAQKLEFNDNGNKKNLSEQKKSPSLTLSHKELIEKIDKERKEVIPEMSDFNRHLDNSYSKNLSTLRNKIFKTGETKCPKERKSAKETSGKRPKK